MQPRHQRRSRAGGGHCLLDDDDIRQLRADGLESLGNVCMDDRDHLAGIASAGIPGGEQRLGADEKRTRMADGGAHRYPEARRSKMAATPSTWIERAVSPTTAHECSSPG